MKKEIIKILFLDIDWVLVPITSHDTNWIKKDVPIHIYNFLYELSKIWVKFIIHSSRRTFLLDLEKFWEYNNLPKYIWNTAPEVSKEKWIEEILKNMEFSIKWKNNVIIKSIILDDELLDTEKIINRFNNNNMKTIFIKTLWKKWIMRNEIKEIREFFDY